MKRGPSGRRWCGGRLPYSYRPGRTDPEHSTIRWSLFADRFRARVDVYAVRWENTRTGAAGWMPAVAGGWRKGMDRGGAVHLPRTPEVVAAHLVGDVFMGLYPAAPRHTCHFLVADFDGTTAMLDALAYAKAARAAAVPAALQISQSGAARTCGCCSPMWYRR